MLVVLTRMHTGTHYIREALEGAGCDYVWSHCDPVYKYEEVLEKATFLITTTRNESDVILSCRTRYDGALVYNDEFGNLYSYETQLCLWPKVAARANLIVDIDINPFEQMIAAGFDVPESMKYARPHTKEQFLARQATKGRVYKNGAWRFLRGDS